MCCPAVPTSTFDGSLASSSRWQARRLGRNSLPRPAPGGPVAERSEGTARRLNEMDLGLIWLVVNETIAGRAVPAGLDRGAARGVPGRLRRIGVPGPPVGQQPERPSQFLALGRQLVSGAGRPLGVRPGYEQ